MELLAPAGSLDALRAALLAGADAVYIGGDRFGARAYADNPGQEDLCRAIEDVHRLDRKLYLTVNTLLKEDEIEDALCNWMEPYYRCGLDGVIVQDFGVLRMLKRAFPDLELHASTQMYVTGAAGARFLREQGFSRVVPARECSLEEIHAISAEGVEVECFVHGAMCYSYSGQCLMSSMIGGRSGNRGRCAGVCRLPFSVYEGKTLRNGKHSAFPLNMKDLCALHLLPELAEAGVDSLKIEGRMKRPEYTAGVVSVYRKYLDLLEADPDAFHVEKEDDAFLFALFNRDGFSEGYYRQHNGADMVAVHNRKQSDSRTGQAEQAYRRVEEFLHTKEKEGALQKEIEGKVSLRKDGIAELRLSAETSGQTVFASAECTDVQEAKNQPITEERVRKQICRTGQEAYRFQTLKTEVDDGLFLPVQSLNKLRREAMAKLEEALQSVYRRSLPVGKEKREEPGKADVKIDRLEPATQSDDAQRKFWIQVEDAAQLAACEETVRELGREELVAGYALPDDLWKESAQILPQKTARRLVLPYVCRQKTEVRIGKLLEKIATDNSSLRPEEILVRNLEELALIRENELIKNAVLDAGMYTVNVEASRFFAENGFVRDTAPLELNRKELGKRDNQRSEFLLYGRLPLMISAQCLQKTTKGCDHMGRTLLLEDRKKASFPVKCVCRDCYNVVYNSLPLCLLDESRAVRSLSFATWRLQFTVEKPDTCRKVLRAFLLHFGESDAKEVLQMQTTKGHFRRGVE